MNVIEKIRRQNQEIKSASRQAVPQQAPGRDGAAGDRPAARCPACIAADQPAVYGWHFWRDPYGTWHCTECEPPATDAMVRDWVLVDRYADRKLGQKKHGLENPADGNPTPEFSIPDFIDVIFDADGSVIFARPGITQRAAREARDNLEWFARREQAMREKERREREHAISGSDRLRR